MTDQEINVAIAEACGWKRGFASANKGKVSGGRCAWINSDGNWKAEHPDYCNDLNAMHEVEKAVLWSDNALWQKYTDNLNLLSKSLAPVLHASARQRAEAFLRTKGLWREAIVEGGK